MLLDAKLAPLLVVLCTPSWSVPARNVVVLPGTAWSVLMTIWLIPPLAGTHVMGASPFVVLKAPNG